MGAEEGGVSPSAPGRDDGVARLLLNAGLPAAPEEVLNHPSVIPWDTVEERVQQVMYKVQTPMVSGSAVTCLHERSCATFVLQVIFVHKEFLSNFLCSSLTK